MGDTASALDEKAIDAAFALDEKVIETKMLAVLSNLDYDFRQYTDQSFHIWLESSYQRRFFFFPWVMPASLDGAWFTDAEYPMEYIFYDQVVPQIHQLHIKLHETAHFFNKHQTGQITRSELKYWLSRPEEAKEFFRQALQRNRQYRTERKELEAEMLSKLIYEQIIQGNYRNELENVSSGSSYLELWNG